MFTQVSTQRFKILDVTLRDGGYRNNFTFPPDYTRRLVKDLSDARIDYIEVGYRNGLTKDGPPLGPSGLSSNAYIEDLLSHCPHAPIGVMVHPHKVDMQDLHDLKALGVSLIRVCMTAPTMEQNIETINACHELGFTTTANIIKVSTRELAEVLSIVETLNQSAVDVIYIADSFGNLVPEVVAEYIRAMRTATDKTLGFHAHNNLSLALANTLTAIANGAGIVDASIGGMGFGIGNLAMEVLAGYLHRVGEGDRIDVLKIFELANFFSQNVQDSSLPLGSVDIFWGLNNLSSHFKQPIFEVAREQNLSVLEVAGWVARQKGIRPVKSEILDCVRSAMVTPVSL